MSTDFTPTAVIETTDDGYTVWLEYRHANVDRPRTQGWGVKPTHYKLALRLARAIEAGAVVPIPAVRADVHGRTYVCGTATVLGRMLNADLRRLGF